MIHDFRDYGEGARIDADLCIVGTGPAGLSLAREFLGSATSVVLLESGGLKREPDAELLNDGESIGLPHQGSREGRARLFGGASKLWEGQCVRLGELDFQRREWVPHSGWPIGKAELDRFYGRAEAFLQIAGERYDATISERFGLVPPALDGAGLEYGYTVLIPEPELGRLYRDEFNRASNVVTLLHATATRIRTGRDPGSAVEHVEVRSPEGTAGQVRAKAFVLCGGGIENARLLLLSNDAQPNGLGNGHDLVGRFLQEHPIARPALLETDSPQTLQEPFTLLYGKRGVRYFPKLRLSPERQRAAQVLGCASQLAFEFASESGAEAAKRLYKALRRRTRPPGAGRDVWRVLSHPRDVAGLVRRYARGRASRSAPVLIWLETVAEQAPHPESRVSLSRRRDQFGSNLPCVDWRLTELDRRTAHTVTEAVATAFGRLGLARLRTAEWLEEPGDRWAAGFSESLHQMGTTRMADDEGRGVVDAACRVYGVPRLYVAGSSVFPTSGSANPTLTIVALSLRLADHLKATVRAR